MIGSPSSEFVALCQAQVRLLTQALGAVSTVVYLAETTAESINPALVPLVAYPETADLWIGLQDGLAAVAEAEAEAEAERGEKAQRFSQGDIQPGAWPQPSSSSDQILPTFPDPIYATYIDGDVSVPRGMDSNAPSQAVGAETSTYPLVLPLSHEGVVVGMMISTRQLPPWTASDYQQAEQVASTLAIACVMDQRSQWLQRQLNQRQLNQADQSETFQNLLHQFRNPLTALQTFGKLMVKRLPLEDTNRPIAEGIVRESRRLQDLAEHFDTAVAEGDEALARPTVPSVSGLLLPGVADEADYAAETDNLTTPKYPEGPKEGPPKTLGIAPAQRSGLGRSLVVKPGEIAEVALPLVYSTLPLAQERDLHLVHHIPTPLPAAWFDPAALGEVLHNLLDNALKYASPGSLVWVTAGLVQQVEGQVFQGIAVGDTGAGIPAGDQAQLFTRHFRGVQAEGKLPGTGLGLAIVQDLVQGMGGHIDLISPVGNPWLPPEAAAYPQNPGALFVVWLRTCSVEALPPLNAGAERLGDGG